MLQDVIAFAAASGAVFYFTWVVFNDVRRGDLSHTRCAPLVTRWERAGTFWLIVSLAVVTAILFAVLALGAASRIVAQLGM